MLESHVHYFMQMTQNASAGINRLERLIANVEKAGASEAARTARAEAEGGLAEGQQTKCGNLRGCKRGRMTSIKTHGECVLSMERTREL